MAVITVGRPKKPAARRNYKISFDVLARLSAISRLEDRSDTSQLERFIKEGSDRWMIDNPTKIDTYQKLVDELISDLNPEELPKSSTSAANDADTSDLN